ncbi:hypothetical protein RRG08_000616 [Elysia crispata]|uniref:Uncharacterized protein n=1 Tax=Elysia crispata TaxID=231223 RepID=A0AAE1CU79_9GAST|nr:hypothetical protein RRG08_000616 [Elysia crispata]
MECDRSSERVLGEEGLKGRGLRATLATDAEKEKKRGWGAARGAQVGAHARDLLHDTARVREGVNVWMTETGEERRGRFRSGQEMTGRARG